MPSKQTGKPDGCGCRSGRDQATLQSPPDDGVTLCPSSGPGPRAWLVGQKLQHDGFDEAGTLTVIQRRERDLSLPACFLLPWRCFPKTWKKNQKHRSWWTHVPSGTAGVPPGTKVRL